MKVQTRPSFSNGLLPRPADWLQIGSEAAELLVLAVGYALLPIWPLITGALARDWRYVTRYPHTVLAAVNHMRAGFRTHAIARHVLRNLVARDAVSPAGSCTHCGNCCLQKSCIFLSFDAAGRSSCRIYGSRLWKILACGDYPIDARDIDLYACPGFTMPSGKTKSKIIVIHPATGVPAATAQEGMAIRET